MLAADAESKRFTVVSIGLVIRVPNARFRFKTRDDIDSLITCVINNVINTTSGTDVVNTEDRFLHQFIGCGNDGTVS